MIENCWLGRRRVECAGFCSGPAGGSNAMATENIEELSQQLIQLRVEHRDLDDAIARLAEGPFVDELQMRRLKKRKLQLKDYISRIESRLIPDMDA